MDVKTEAVQTRSFNAADRCDKCGAQAKMEYVAKAGSLLFCGHHSTENHILLLAQGFEPVAETERVEAAVSLEDA